MAKLFALEDAELETGAVELEAAPEVGEVADAQVEVDADAGEITEVEAGVSEGMGAADQLEQVEEVVEQAAEGEGLDPVAAEAIKIAVEAICARIGANPKSVYSLYATENFKSASSRKANTKYALEGLGEFLKNLWDKIKSALTSLWEKVRAFWNKHVSALGRTLKALESTKDKLSQLKGSGTYDPVEVPGSLRSVFPTKGQLGASEVAEYAKRVGGALAHMQSFRLLEDAAKATSLGDIKTMVTNAKGSGVEVEFGTEAAPMAGGVYFKWTFKLETENDDGVEIITLDVEEDHGKTNDGRKDAQMDIANKDELKAIVTGLITSTKDLIKYRDKAEQRMKAVSNNFKALDKAIQGIQDPKQAKEAKNEIRAFNLVMSKGPMMEAKLLSLQLATIKGALAYVSTCMKHYKQL